MKSSHPDLKVIVNVYTSRKEMLALVWAVLNFQGYLSGQAFTAHTDHHSLKWLHCLRSTCLLLT